MHANPLGFEFQETLAKHIGLTDVRVVLNPNWGSVQTGHREMIRQHIYSNVEKSENLLNLQALPRLTEGQVSVSHNKMIGGYAFTKTTSSFGFDIEMNSRLNGRNVLKFASTMEFAEAPSASALWTAKEALYKSLHFSLQPTVIGELALKNWITIDKNWYLCQNCELRETPLTDFVGVVYCDENFTLAFFRGPSN